VRHDDPSDAMGLFQTLLLVVEVSEAVIHHIVHDPKRHVSDAHRGTGSPEGNSWLERPGGLYGGGERVFCVFHLGSLCVGADAKIKGAGQNAEG
jgi:hypothetical protein